MNIGTLGGKPIHDPVSPHPESGPINFFITHSGAACPGWGRFLMTAMDFHALDSPGQQGTLPLVLSVTEKAAQTVTIMVTLVRSQTYGETPKSSSSDANDISGADDMVAVTVMDQRATKGLLPIRFIVNIPTDKAQFSTAAGSTTNPAGVDDGPGAIDGAFGVNIDRSSDDEWPTILSVAGDDWTPFDGESDLVDPLFDEIDQANVPTDDVWRPRSLLYDYAPINRIREDLANTLMQQIGYDLRLDKYYLYDAGTLDDENDGTFSDMTDAAVLLEKRTILRSDKRLPSTLRFIFRRVDVDYDSSCQSQKLNQNGESYIPTSTGDIDTIDAWSASYAKDVSVSEGNPDLTVPILVTSHWALYSANTIRNKDALDTMANDLKARWVKEHKLVMSEEVYAGIWPLFNDGQIRTILWTNNSAGAQTRILRNTTREYMGRDWQQYVDDAFKPATFGILSGCGYDGIQREWLRRDWPLVWVTIGSLDTDNPNTGYFNGTIVQTSPYDFLDGTVVDTGVLTNAGGPLPCKVIVGVNFGVDDPATSIVPIGGCTAFGRIIFYSDTAGSGPLSGGDWGSTGKPIAVVYVDDVSYARGGKVEGSDIALGHAGWTGGTDYLRYSFATQDAWTYGKPVSITVSSDPHNNTSSKAIEFQKLQLIFDARGRLSYVNPLGTSSIPLNPS